LKKKFPIISKAKAFVIMLCITATQVFAQPLTAQSYIVITQDGRVLAEHNADDMRSLASITKLVALNGIIPADDTIYITLEEKDTIKGTRMRLKTGPYIQHELFEAALISSNNEAAKAIGKSVPNLINDVNKLNAERGLQLLIVEPSGLDPSNIGNARSLAKLLWLIKDQPSAQISVTARSKLAARTTNSFLGKPGWEFNVSKTGYIKESGGCLVTLVKIGGEWVAIAILGSTSVHERWVDLAKLRRQLQPSEVFYEPGSQRVKIFKKKRHR
jgi:D-alanyl-D-alanine endopeptidase (penicillin-binding protein 7)